jgi:hypothetical protein
MRFVAAIVVALAFATGAPACSIAIVPHELDAAEQAVDRSAPSPPEVSVASIKRGRAAEPGPGGLVVANSCDDIGMITLRLNGATDDRTVADRMGYVVVVSEGAPEGLQPADAVRAPAGELVLHWIDGATNDQEPLDFTVSVLAVDLAGNRSSASEAIPVVSRERMSKE